MITKQDIQADIERLQAVYDEVSPRIQTRLEYIIKGEQYWLEHWDEKTGALMRFVELVRHHSVYKEVVYSYPTDSFISYYVDKQEVDEYNNPDLYNLISSHHDIHPNYPYYIREREEAPDKDTTITLYDAIG